VISSECFPVNRRAPYWIRVLKPLARTSRETSFAVSFTARS